MKISCMNAIERPDNKDDYVKLHEIGIFPGVNIRNGSAPFSSIIVSDIFP